MSALPDPDMFDVEEFLTRLRRWQDLAQDDHEDAFTESLDYMLQALTLLTDRTPSTEVALILFAETYTAAVTLLLAD